MDFEALRETKAYLKFSWPSRFRNWGNKKLKLFLHFTVEFSAPIFLEPQAWWAGRGGSTWPSRLRVAGALGNLPEKSMGWEGAAAGSAWTGALRLSSQSLARNGQEAGPHYGLVHYYHNTNSHQMPGGFIVLSSSGFCQTLYINIYTPHFKDRKVGLQ